MSEIPYWNTPFLYLYGGGSLYSNIMNVGLRQGMSNMVAMIAAMQYTLNKKW